MKNYEFVKILSDEEKGQVLTAICEYAKTGQVPGNLPYTVFLCFEVFKKDFDEIKRGE